MINSDDLFLSVCYFIFNGGRHLNEIGCNIALHYVDTPCGKERHIEYEKWMHDQQKHSPASLVLWQRSR